MQGYVNVVGYVLVCVIVTVFAYDYKTNTVGPEPTKASPSGAVLSAPRNR